MATQEHGAHVMTDAIVVNHVSVQLTQHGSLQCFGTGYVRSPTSMWHPKFDWMLDRNNVLTIQFDPRNKHVQDQRLLERHTEIEHELRQILNQMSERLVSKI